MIRYTLALLIVLTFVATPTAFAQVYSSPTEIYNYPGNPYCVTFTVESGAWEVVDFEVYYPWGGPVWWNDIQLDGNGQFINCSDGNWTTGQYVMTGVVYWDWNYVGSWAPFYVHPAPPTPTVYSYGAGCDNGDCIWATGVNFGPDSRVVVAGENWAYGQWYYGSAWQMSPVVDVSPDGQFLALQVTDPNLRALFGSSGVYFLVVNPAGLNSGWILVQSSPPIVTSATPTCADKYCLSFSGSFPMSAYVDFRVPGSGDILPNAYTDLVVTPTQITLRLNPSVRYAYDTTGLNAWVVNPTLANWSGGTYLPPVNRAVIGYVEGVGGDGQQYYLSGWACAKTQTTSINVQVYVNGGATFAFSGTANQASESGLQDPMWCDAPGTNYRFYLPIPHWVTQNHGGQAFYAYGVSPIGLSTNLLGTVGNVTVPGVDRSITGVLSGISVQGNSFFLNGWACAKTYPNSITVRAYVGSNTGNDQDATGVAFEALANQASEPAVAAECNTSGTNYRYSIQIPFSFIQQSSGQPIRMRGVSPYGLPNLLLNGTLYIPGIAPTSLKEYIYLGGRVIAVESQ